jgi:predicted dehydrogenase
MNILVLGCGSIGKRHIKNLIKIGFDPKKITGFDPRLDRLDEVKKLGIKTTSLSLKKLLKEEKFYASIVCSPTNLHIKQGILLAKNKVHILMEKPLCNNLSGSKEFEKILIKNKVFFMIAYIFRFNPMIEKIKSLLKNKSIGNILYVRGEFSEYLPDWHPWENYRHFYMAKKSMGGGSILDQSHLFDIMHFIFGDFKEVIGINSKISKLQVKADDIAELIIKFKSGLIASLHTDMFGRKHRKDFEIKGETGNILCDFYTQKVSLYKSKNKKMKVFKNFFKDPNTIYIKELKHFFSCIKKKKKSIATFQDSIKTMELILAACKSEKRKKQVRVQ